MDDSFTLSGSTHQPSTQGPINELYLLKGTMGIRKTKVDVLVIMPLTSAGRKYKVLGLVSTSQAYLSPSLCVRKLEWGGITEVQFASIVQKAGVKVQKSMNEETDFFVTKLNAETACLDDARSG